MKVLTNIKNYWRGIALAIGNSKRINCKSKEDAYGPKISLSIFTVYLLMFTVGMFLGDLSTGFLVQLEEIFGFLSTVAVFSLGFSVIYQCIMNAKKFNLACIVSLALIGTQTVFVFNLFPMSVQHLFYYSVSTISMFFVYTLVHHEKLSNPTDHNNSKMAGFFRLPI